MGRPTKANSLSQQDVIKAAIACIELEGASALGVNRVARALKIKPPAIYKHFQGNSELKKAVALAIYQDFFAELKQKITGIQESPNILRIGGHTIRNFARSHPGLYQVMMQFKLQLDDPESASIIRESQNLFATLLNFQDLERSQLIDMMRMVNAVFVGFIALEESGLFTLSRSTDDSFEVMLDALLVAVEHIGKSQ